MAGIHPQTLAHELNERSIWVRAKAAEAKSAGMVLDEETITKLVLIDLATRFSADLEVRQFNKHQEGINGADWHWEWWWEGETAWFGCRVQAKLLKKVGSEFGYHFDYESGDPPKRQVDKLIAAAEAAEVPAVYVLYNGPDLDLDEFDWACPGWPAEPSFMGVGLLAAEAARAFADANTLGQGAVNNVAVPWACLATCTPFCPLPFLVYWTPDDLGFPPGTPPGDLALRAASAIAGTQLRVPSSPDHQRQRLTVLWDCCTIW